MKLLKELYGVYSPSGNERKMKRFIARHIGKDVNVEYDAKGNMYLTKGVAETYPCIAAHLDQVQDKHSRDFKALEAGDIIIGYSQSKRQQQGLGADDKNGIWIALKCLAKYDVMKVAFFREEEIGCGGSRKADMDFFKNCRFVIEPDRRGAHDLITSIGSTSLCSDKFLKDCGFEKFGYKETNGMITDVLELVDNGIGISCINLSCGYYAPHTDEEFTNKTDLLNCLAFVENVIETCTEVYPYEYHPYGQSSKFDWASYYGYDDVPDFIPKLSDYDNVEDLVAEYVYHNWYCEWDTLWDYIASELEPAGWTKEMFKEEGMKQVYTEDEKEDYYGNGLFSGKIL